MKSQLHGTVKLVFQPAEEEASIGGGRHIAASGKLDDIEEIYGLHVWPELPVGQVGLKSWQHPIVSTSTSKEIHPRSAIPDGTDALVYCPFIIDDADTHFP